MSPILPFKFFFAFLRSKKVMGKSMSAKIALRVSVNLPVRIV